MVLGTSESSEVILLLVSALLLLIGVASALIALYLHLKKGKRFGEAEVVEWSGRGFDPTGIAPRLQAVRRDYLNELRSRPRPYGHPPGAVEAARRIVARFSYFCSVKSEQER